MEENIKKKEMASSKKMSKKKKDTYVCNNVNCKGILFTVHDLGKLIFKQMKMLF